jgi:hypothetical protein
MAYNLAEISRMIKVYHEVETAANIFLFQSSFAVKHKKGGAERTLKAIEEYKKLPQEVRNELEKDKEAHVSKIIELEKLCREVIGGK